MILDEYPLSDEMLAFCKAAIEDMPEALLVSGARKMPDSFKGLGLGGALLADALDRAIHAEIAAYALVVDAKNESAAAFYQHHGLIALPSQPMTLFLPLATASGFAS